MLKIENLSFRYGKNKPLVLNGVNLDLEEGQIGIILGKNGSGKSTLFKTIVGIEKPTNGSICLNEVDVLPLSRSKRSSLIAYVPQTIEFGSLSVYDSILMGRVSRFGLADSKKDQEITEMVIEEMGLADLALRNVNELSGGERQKIAIARALVQEPSLLVLDEPTGNLDMGNEQLILKEAKRLSSTKGITIIVAIHDINEALSFGDKFFFLKDGAIAAQGDKEIVTPELIRSTYGVEVEIHEIGGRKIVVQKGE